MARSRSEWELILKYDGLVNSELQKRIDFLRSLPKSGLPLDSDEQELLKDLLELQQTRNKKPMVSTALKKVLKKGIGLGFTQREYDRMREQREEEKKKNPDKARLKELISLIDNQEGKIEIMQREIATNKFGEWSKSKENAESRIAYIKEDLKPLIAEYKALRSKLGLDREAQSLKYKFPKVEQSKVDGSPTAKVDHEMKFFVEADDLSGGGRTATYWAEEIVRSIRYNKGGDAQAAYDNVIADAEAQGLTKDQKKQIDTLLVRWHIPVPVKNFDPETDPFVPVKSDYTIAFKQKQVAASLIEKRMGKEACDDFLAAISHYKANRKAILMGHRKAQLDGKITTLLKANFSREEVADEMPSWDFPDELKKQALAALLPKKMVLAGARIPLSNQTARQRQAIVSRAITAISTHSNQEPLSTPQKLRLAAISACKRLASPYWIQTQQQGEANMHLDDLSPSFRNSIDRDLTALMKQNGFTPLGIPELKALSKKYGVPVEDIKGLSEAVRTRGKSPISVYARLEDGRVLEATIQENGEFKQKVYLDKNLKIALKKAFTPEQGWVDYLEGRFGQNESLEDEASEEEGTTNEEEDTSPKFAQSEYKVGDRVKADIEETGIIEGVITAIDDPKKEYHSDDIPELFPDGKMYVVKVTKDSPSTGAPVGSTFNIGSAQILKGNLREEQLQDPLEPQRVDIEQLQGR